MWRVWYLKHRVREILENKDGVGVVEKEILYCTGRYKKWKEEDYCGGGIR